MKKQVLWLVVPSLIFGVVGCKEKKKTEQMGGPETPLEQLVDPIKPPAVPEKVALSAEQRAKMLGFAAYLPQQTEFMISVHGGNDATKRIMKSKLWRTIAGEMGMDLGDELEEVAEEVAEEAAEEVATGPSMMFGQEFTLAMGAGTSEQLSHLVHLNSRLNYFQMSGFIRAISQAIADGEADSFLNHYGDYSEELFLNLLQDSESGIGLFEKLNMPPMYVAFKTTDETREAVNQQVAGSLQMMSMAGPAVQPVEVSVGGSTFNGYQLMGEKVSELMSEERSSMEEKLSAETVDRILKAIAQKNLFVLSGVHKEYVVLFIGSSKEDLVLAADAKESLLGGDALAFCDEYEANDLLAVLYGKSEGLSQLIDKAKGGFASISAGIRDGLSGSDQLGDTRNIEALLRMVEDREAALQALGKIHGGGTIAYFEDGLKIESYGGYDAGMLDWDSPNRLSSLAAGEDVLLFANLTTDPVYDAKARAYIEALLETGYTAALKVSELPIKDQDMIEFKNYVQMFDTKFRTDLLTFWDGFSGGFCGSLGSERALVVDLGGSVPAIPGFPQAMVDEGKFPRVSWLAPVADRKQLTVSWDKMNASLTSMSASISEMLGKEIPMQKPLSSEKDGYTTWFFALPFCNDDFVPSVTVNDQWFAASTSKNQAIELLQQASAGGEMTTGFNMSVNFKALEKYAKESFKVVLKNREELGISAGDLDSVNRFIEAFGDLDKMSMHVRRDKGVLRSSFHFVTR